MADVPIPRPKNEMSAESALVLAWRWWLVLLVLPFIIFLGVIWNLMDQEAGTGNAPLAQGWFLAAMAFLAVAGPGAFFWRSHVFKAYWSGERVLPRDYLSGMLAVWWTLEIAGIFSLSGCLLSRQLLPNLLPAVVAFMLYVPLWPSGRAMVDRIGGTDDPGTYAEPR
jgi:hypothetical protein